MVAGMERAGAVETARSAVLRRFALSLHAARAARGVYVKPWDQLADYEQEKFRLDASAVLATLAEFEREHAGALTRVLNAEDPGP
jgi:hypothetical protein